MHNYVQKHAQDDQAAGLRRIMATPKPRVVSILSASPSRDQARLMANLATPIATEGSDVLIVHASHESSESIYEISKLPALLDVINEKSLLHSAIKNSGNGFSVAKLMPSHQLSTPLDSILSEQLNKIFTCLAEQYEIILVDAALNADDVLPIQALNDGEIIIKLTRQPESIKASYALIKRIYGQLGSRSFGIIVDNASDIQAQTVFSNLSDVAKRFMRIDLEYFGAIPPDIHLTRAAKLGRSVLDAFPLASASAAFKQIALRLDSRQAQKAKTKLVSHL
jgi:flagellar biosynthesis protein FlhG